LSEFGRQGTIALPCLFLKEEVMAAKLLKGAEVAKEIRNSKRR